MEEQKENKSFKPSGNKIVKVKINKNRAIEGVGRAGDVVEMPEQTAAQYEQDGYVTIIKEK